MGKFAEQQKKLQAMLKQGEEAMKGSKAAAAAKASGDKVKAALQKAQQELKTAED
jgi:hypothetical protein